MVVNLGCKNFRINQITLFVNWKILLAVSVLTKSLLVLFPNHKGSLIAHYPDVQIKEKLNRCRKTCLVLVSTMRWFVCFFLSNLSAAFRRWPPILTGLIAMACDVVIKAFVTEKGGDMQRSLEPLIWIYAAQRYWNGSRDQGINFQ